MMSEESSVGERIGKGLFLVSFLAIAVAGWLAYNATMAQDWLRQFAEELNTRATITGEFQSQSAFPTLRNRPDPDSPYICFSRVASFDWDRLYVIPSGGPVPVLLDSLMWPEETVADINQRLSGDPRYQIIAFVAGERVVEYGYYYTIWGDLSSVATPQGFDRYEAVFVAESNGQSFIVSPAPQAGQEHCANELATRS